MQGTTSASAAQCCTGQILDPRTAAHQLLELGLPITICRPGKKAPIGKAWHQKSWTHDEVDIEFLAHADLNVGIILGPRSVMIDLEVDGPDGDAVFEPVIDAKFTGPTQFAPLCDGRVE